MCDEEGERPGPASEVFMTNLLSYLQGIVTYKKMFSFCLLHGFCHPLSLFSHSRREELKECYSRL